MASIQSNQSRDKFDQDESEVDYYQESNLQNLPYTLEPLNDVTRLRNSACIGNDDTAATGGDSSSVGSAWAPVDSNSTHEGLDVDHHTNDAHFNSHGLEGTGQSHDHSHEPTLQDRLVGAATGAGTTALWGSLELLKLAGGLTLSTTGKLVAPPLKVTQQILLPSLWAAISDFIRQATPTRVKDWFQILSASLYHLYAVLKNTHRGQAFRSRILTVGGDLVDCVSSDESRQVITDAMASVVKLSEAMNTPEFKLFLDQLTIVGSRFVDAAASGRNKQLLNDLKETVWSGVELMSDPHTIVALAEVTATLCHTLEMEDALYRRSKHYANSKSHRQQRRQERNQFSQQAYVEPDLMQHHDATVEQVIMSGLGSRDTACSFNNNGDRLPQSVAFENPRPTNVATTTASCNESVESYNSGEDSWKKAGRDKLDTIYLVQSIRSRGQRMDFEKAEHRDKFKRPVRKADEPDASAEKSFEREDAVHVGVELEDIHVETIVESCTKEPLKAKSSKSKLQRQNKVKLNSDYDDSSKVPGDFHGNGGSCNDNARSASSPVVESDTAITQFYHTLDRMLAQKRANAIKEVTEAASLRNGRRSSTISGTELESLSRAVKSGRAVKTVKKIERNWLMQHFRLLNGTKVLNDNVTVYDDFVGNNSIVLAVVAVSIMIVWLGFGCFGMYTFVKPWFLSRDITPPSPVTAATQEIVIRIVKEIVHVDQSGAEILAQFSDHSTDREMIAECISAVSKQ